MELAAGKNKKPSKRHGAPWICPERALHPGASGTPHPTLGSAAHGVRPPRKREEAHPSGLCREPPWFREEHQQQTRQPNTQSARGSTQQRSSSSHYAAVAGRFAPAATAPLLRLRFRSVARKTARASTAETFGSSVIIRSTFDRFASSVFCSCNCCCRAQSSSLWCCMEADTCDDNTSSCSRSCLPRSRTRSSCNSNFSRIAAASHVALARAARSPSRLSRRDERTSVALRACCACSATTAARCDGSAVPVSDSAPHDASPAPSSHI
mmetsp:Transcript_58606/g.156695  ORF Transcript_58606/g.156695 Transcript_58606/m.156695 type:complete len:267 (+) Transcript_58606:124-924(+)